VLDFTPSPYAAIIADNRTGTNHSPWHDLDVLPDVYRAYNGHAIVEDRALADEVIAIELRRVTFAGGMVFLYIWFDQNLLKERLSLCQDPMGFCHAGKPVREREGIEMREIIV